MPEPDMTEGLVYLPPGPDGVMGPLVLSEDVIISGDAGPIQ
jgi:hypothetical protein